MNGDGCVQVKLMAGMRTFCGKRTKDPLHLKNHVTEAKGFLHGKIEDW